MRLPTAWQSLLVVLSPLSTLLVLPPCLFAAKVQPADTECRFMVKTTGPVLHCWVVTAGTVFKLPNVAGVELVYEGAGTAAEGEECNNWLEAVTGRSTILAAVPGEFSRALLEISPVCKAGWA